MGECCKGSNGRSPVAALDATAPMVDRRFNMKQVFDNVHSNISLDPLSLKFIDTEQFQRLRDLKQLGLTYLVYPGAVHTRFEHSLGVYWLANESVQSLKYYQGAELDIDNFDMQTVKLAGLLHDIGHGPFSHLFEHEFMPRAISGSKWSHEQMSVQMVDYVVDEHHIDIDPSRLKIVKEMILASSKEYAMPKSVREKMFLYDIVANGRNGIDVDKFDYISRDCRACGLGCNFEYKRLIDQMRVMGDEICYPAKEYLTVSKLFNTRADLHRTVYTHAKVKAVELMLVDALVKADNYLKISSYPLDPAEYWKLDDTIVKTIETSHNRQLKESRDILLRLRRRDLYRFCNEYTVPKEKLQYFKDITPQDIVCSQRGGLQLKEEDVAVSNVKIDLTRGMNNPLERLLLVLSEVAVLCIAHIGPYYGINFFKDYVSNDKFPVSDGCVSHLLPSNFQDRIVRVYAKKPELVEAVSEAFVNFQMKMYGVKAQIHDTPEKKKQRRF